MPRAIKAGLQALALEADHRFNDECSGDLMSGQPISKRDIEEKSKNDESNIQMLQTSF